LYVFGRRRASGGKDGVCSGTLFIAMSEGGGEGGGKRGGGWGGGGWRGRGRGVVVSEFNPHSLN